MCMNMNRLASFQIEQMSFMSCQLLECEMKVNYLLVMKTIQNHKLTFKPKRINYVVVFSNFHYYLYHY